MIGCADTHAAIVVDPEISQIENYLSIAAREGLWIHYVLDTHTHADHFSASKAMADKYDDVAVVMHRNSRAPFVDMRVDDGESLIVGKLRLRIMHTPGHTADSMCVLLDDRVLTGDTLLIGGTGRTDLPSGDPEQLYDSLFNGLLKLDPKLMIFPGHDYKRQGHSTIAQELAENPRLQKKQRHEFVEQMRALDLKMPTHLTEALRTNLSGGKTITQLIDEAAGRVSFMSIREVKHRLESNAPNFVILDVRERDAFDKGHIPGALHIPRGQLELRVNETFPDPLQRIIVCCEYGKVSTLATDTLRRIGFGRAVALDGGMQAWREQGNPVETGKP